MKMVKRSTGRSATAAAAYRAAARIGCEREGRTHDYTRKQGVEHSAIFTPDGSPDIDRATLWNAAEKSENRKNSQTAREWLFSLPDELTAEGRRAAVERVAAHLVERHGVAVDLAIHAPHRDGDQRNWHCHMLMTTRRMERGELTDKAREFDDRKTGPTIAKDLREYTARALNYEVTREHGDGRPVNVEHRSFKERGIEREPSTHRGSVVTHMERKAELRAERQREFAERAAMRRRHEVQHDNLKGRHELERAKYARVGAQDGRERVERIKAGVDKGDHADAPLRGGKWLKAMMARNLAREEADRATRKADRRDLASREIDSLRTAYKHGRTSLLDRQQRERDELQKRQQKDREQMERAIRERKRLAEIRRRTGRDLAKEERERMKQRKAGMGRAYTPFSR